MQRWIRKILVMICCLQTILSTGCRSSTDQERLSQREPIRGQVVEEESGGVNGKDGSTEVRDVSELQTEGDRGDDEAIALVDACCPFGPTAMRIHPLTRLLRSAENESPPSTIEVRLELTDQFGDTTKGLGLLQLELFARGMVGSNGRGRGARVNGLGRRLLSWEPEFGEVESNAEHFDRVTRTYVFSLDLEEGIEFPQRCILRVTLMTHDSELTDRVELVFR